MKQNRWHKWRNKMAVLLVGCMVIVFCLVDLELHHHVHHYEENGTCPICRQLQGVTSQLHQMLGGRILPLVAFCQLVLVILMIGITSYHLLNVSLIKWKVRLDD